MLDQQGGHDDDRQPGRREHAPAPITRSSSLPPRWRTVKQYPPHMHGIGDILNSLIAEVLEVKRQLTLYVFADRVRNAYAAGVGEILQSRRDVDPIAVYLIAFDHHVAEVDADTKLHPAIGRESTVFRFECALYVNGALDSIYDTGKLGQHTVSSRVYESPVVLPD